MHEVGGVSAVVVASGYGSIREVNGKPFPKVLEEMAGLPMIVHVVRIIFQAERLNPVVVVNPLFGDAIRTVLEAHGYTGIEYAVQPTRSGAADAVFQAVEKLEAQRAGSFLAIYADMPLWRPATIRKLIEHHREQRHRDERHPPVLSMVTVPLNGHHPPELERYGRIIRDIHGKILRVVEPAVANDDQKKVNIVNPSLWVWNLAWFKEHESQVVPVEKKDGREPERQLPALVSMVHTRIGEIHLQDPVEALGVNDADELKQVRTLMAGRHHHPLASGVGK